MGPPIRNHDPDEWRPAPQAPALANDEIHVWRGVLNRVPVALHELLLLLSPDEQARARRFHFQADRDRFILVQGLLRLLLARYAGRPPETLVFEYGPTGKPALTSASGGDRIGFSGSYSGGLVLFAVAPIPHIGVDIEERRPDVAIQDVMCTMLSERERKGMATLPEARRHQVFFDVWTCKEAFVKAIGAGLSMEMHRVDVSLGLDEPPALLAVDGTTEPASKWTLMSLRPGPNHAGALAVETRPWALHYWNLSVENPETWSRPSRANRR